MNRCLHGEYFQADWTDSDVHSQLSVDEDEWSRVDRMFLAPLRQPPASYSKRADHLARLREIVGYAHKLANGEPCPNDKAIGLAVEFINALPEGALNCRLAVSDGGEINFLFDGNESLFHINIWDGGGVSYYGKVKGAEYFGDDTPIADFPFFKLLSVDAQSAR